MPPREPGAGQIRTARDNVSDKGLTDVIVNSAIQYAIGKVLPAKALQRVKRWMRRKCRKDYGMSVREYYNRLIFVNDNKLPNNDK